MQVDLTKSEVVTLQFYLHQSLIDAEGMLAVGVGNEISVNDLKSVIAKIGGPHGGEK